MAANKSDTSSPRLAIPKVGALLVQLHTILFREDFCCKPRSGQRRSRIGSNLELRNARRLYFVGEVS